MVSEKAHGFCFRLLPLPIPHTHLDLSSKSYSTYKGQSMLQVSECSNTPFLFITA